jgi:chromosome partitioning protein
LANAGFKVLAIDLDPRGDLTRVLSDGKLDGLPDFGDLLLSDGDPNTFVYKTDHPRISLIPASYGMNQTVDALRVKHKKLSYGLVEKKLSQYSQRFDFAIFDCKPDTDFVTAAALYCANEIIVPAECSFMGLGGIIPLLDSLRVIYQDRTIPKIYLLPTKFSKQDTVSRDSFLAMKGFAHNMNLRLAPPVPRSILYDKAMQQCKAVHEIRGGEHKHIYPYKSIAEELKK